MKPTALLLAALLVGCSKPAKIVLLDDGHWTNTPAISTNKDALNGLSEQVHGTKRTQDLAQYWHDAYYKHQAEFHSGLGLFSLTLPADDKVCTYAGIWNDAIGDADYAPFFSVTMPCGYTYELRWGDTIPGSDVPCPCGNDEHWIFRFWRSQLNDTNVFRLTSTNLPSNTP